MCAGILWAARQVDVNLRPTTNKVHLLVELKEVSSKKTPKKRRIKKVFKEVVVRESESSSEFDDVFDADFSAPSTKAPRSLMGV